MTVLIFSFILCGLLLVLNLIQLKGSGNPFLNGIQIAIYSAVSFTGLLMKFSSMKIGVFHFVTILLLLIASYLEFKEAVEKKEFFNVVTYFASLLPLVMILGVITGIW